MSELLLPFQFPFMQTAFLIVALISVPCRRPSSSSR